MITDRDAGQPRGDTPNMLSTKRAVAASSHVGEPIRADLFGPERLEQHAASLAAADYVAEKYLRGRDLLPRVRVNGRVPLDAYHDIVDAVAAKREITPVRSSFGQLGVSAPPSSEIDSAFLA